MSYLVCLGKYRMTEVLLHLTLKKKWFDLIKSGEKKIEYQRIKDYWKTRLFYSVNNEEYIRGLISIGAPIFNPVTGRVMGGVSFDSTTVETSLTSLVV